MPDADKSSPRQYVADFNLGGQWCVYEWGNIDAPVCRIPDGDGTEEAVARRIAAALNRGPAFEAALAALKGLLHAFLRVASEGDGVHEDDVPTVDAATAALKLAEES
jgi:hypothetical protein